MIGPVRGKWSLNHCHWPGFTLYRGGGTKLQKRIVSVSISASLCQNECLILIEKRFLFGNKSPVSALFVYSWQRGQSQRQISWSFLICIVFRAHGIERPTNVCTFYRNTSFAWLTFRKEQADPHVRIAFSVSRKHLFPYYLAQKTFFWTGFIFIGVYVCVCVCMKLCVHFCVCVMCM